MSKADSNKKPVGDTSRRKSDALRAEDIMPPYGAGSKKAKSGKKSSSSKGQKESEIPKFDLAEQILAEHRKVASAKRKAPGKKTGAPRQEQQVEAVGHSIEQPTPAPSEGQQIIAEIVARDIERLCEGNS